MPCNCDHMEPSQHEAESKRVAKHIIFILTSLRRPIPPTVVNIANNFYGEPSKVHELTAMLCKICAEAPEEHIYNAHNAGARKLADWWGAHQEADKVKAEAAKRKELRQETAAKALAKLSPEEIEALNIKPK